MARARTDHPRGVLKLASGGGKLQLARYLASAPLDAMVEHYWLVAWDLCGEPPHQQQTLPHASVHLVFEWGQARVYGVTRGVFARELAGRGRVFGVKFRPGGFYPFSGAPVSRITDRTVPAASVFGAGVDALVGPLLSPADDLARVRLIEDFLCALEPRVDEAALSVGRMVDMVVEDRQVLRVEDLAARVGRSTRTLERLFSRYVGVSPRWVIKRARLHEAAERIDRAERVDWSALAQELGYFDQAHFIRDFKRTVGRTPGEYVSGD